MNDTIKPSAGNVTTLRSMQPPSILELFGIAEITHEDISSTRIVLVLQPVGVAEIRSITDDGLKGEILDDITTRANDHQTPKFYFSEEGATGGGIYCNLSRNIFRVIGYRVLNRGSSLPPVPPGLMHMIFKPALPDYMKIPTVGMQLRETLGSFPGEFCYPVEIKLTSKNLLKLMFLPSRYAYSEDGPFDLYFKLQWRLLYNHLQSFYGTEILQLGEQHNEGVYSHVMYGVGYRVFNDIACCAGEARLMYRHPRALARANTVMSCAKFTRCYTNMIRSLGHAMEVESPDGTELPVMSALYVLSAPSLQCVKDLTGLDQQREIVARLLCDADLRTAVVTGALKAVATMYASDSCTGRINYDVFTARFLPRLAMNTSGLPESIYGLVSTYLDCDPAYNIDITVGIITQLCAIPGFHRAAAISEGGGVNIHSILLNGTARSVIARDHVEGYAMMAEALVRSRSSNTDVWTLYGVLTEEWGAQQRLDAEAPEDVLSYFRHSVSRLDKSGLQELVAAMVADQISALLFEGEQCSAELLTDPRIGEVRNEAVINACMKASENGPLSDFFPSLMQDKIRTHHVATKLEYGLRLPGGGPSPTSMSGIDATAPDSGIGR